MIDGLSRVKEFQLLICLSGLLFSIGCTSGVKEVSKVNSHLTPRIAGEYVHVFDPNAAREEHKGEWYCNDHTFIQDADGLWHCYGIVGHRPADPWNGENKFFHATSEKLIGGDMWKDQGHALETKPGVERVLWAPHVRMYNNKLYMFYNSGNMRRNARTYASWGYLHIATSDASDGFEWKRDELNPIFSDPGQARDSFVTRIGDRYLWYYTRSVSEIDLDSAIAVRTSPDLVHWSGPRIVHTQSPGGHWAGNTESPQVIEKDGLYYLFICLAVDGYDKTHVYWSADPMNFPRENFVCELEAHAPEVIQDNDGKWYISTCGWERNGVYLAPLVWE